MREYSNIYTLIKELEQCPQEQMIVDEKITEKLKLKKFAIISAVGTRTYYKKRGYVVEKKYGYALKKL